MTGYAADSNAQAVVLGDYGSINVADNWDTEYERHRRIKLFSEAGYGLATVSLTYFAGRDGQRVHDIEGQTFVTDPGGRVRRVELDRKSVFEEDLEGDRKRVTFTLPALEPGAVVEYRYKITAGSPLQVPRWYFQAEEPVLWTELRFQHPQDLAYAFITQGNPDFTVETQQEGLRPGIKTRLYRWVATEVPALREERYMTTLEDFIQKIDIQLVEYYRPGFGATPFLKTWEQVAEELGDHQDFGRRLRVGGDVRRQAEALTAGIEGARDKARAIHDFVRGSIVWDGTHRVFAEHRLEDVLDAKRGSSAEVNLLLVALLREAGLDAEPALVSTRTNGRIVRQYPLILQFDHVLAAAKLDGRTDLMDATDPLRPMDLLPVDVLGGEAWVVGQQAWVAVPGDRSEYHVRIEADLLPDGTLSGTLLSEHSGYAALQARHHLRDLGAESFVTDHLVDDVPGIEVGDVAITGQDEHEAPLVTTVSFTVPAYAQAVGDLVLVNPLVTMRTDENPFKLRERTYPVDFAYPFASSYEAVIDLPDGVEADEVPGDALLLLPVRGGGYERTVTVEDGALRVAAQMQINRPVFEANLYAGLKRFFDRSVAADEETVVLKRVAGPSGGEGPAMGTSEETTEQSTETAGQSTGADE